MKKENYMINSKGMTSDKEYRSYPINNGNKKDFICYEKTLNQVIDQVEYMSSKHSKVLCVRCDIRNDRDLENKIMRRDMTRITENVKRAIERKYKDSPNKPELTVTWTTENDGTSPHYHCLFAVNGNAIQNGHAIHDALNKAVQHHLETDKKGLVEFCKSNEQFGKMIDRNSPDFVKQIENAVYMGSYLAKTHTKENRPKGARISSTSRLPSGWKETVEYDRFIQNRFGGKSLESNQIKDDNSDVNSQSCNTTMCPTPSEACGIDDEDFAPEIDLDEYYSNLREEKRKEKEMPMFDGPDFLPQDVKDSLAKQGKIVRTRF